MKFSDLAGQHNAKQFFLRLVNHNIIGQAYLLSEKETQGALPLAIAFAQYINCSNKQHNNHTDSCGTCPACLKIQDVQHPDLHFTYPIIKDTNTKHPISTEYIKEWQQFLKSNPYQNAFDWLQIISGENNKQGNIFSEECHEIIRKLSLKTFEAEYKIQIIWMAELLKNEGNKLLKLIEEPPPKTLFIFITNNKDLILPTILSRLQEVVLDNLTDKEIADYFDQQGFDPAHIQAIIPLCNGNIRDAFYLLNVDVEDNFIYLQKMLNSAFLSKTETYIEWSELMSSKGREAIKHFLLYALKMFQLSYTHYFSLNTPNHHIHDNKHTKLLNTIASKIPIESLFETITLIEEYYYFIERNGNEPLTLHAMLIKMNAIIRHQQHVSVQ